MPTSTTTGARPCRSQIETWSISHLSDAAASWRAAATASENLFDEHRANVASPGGTTWEGDAKDAALDRVTADTVVVGRQGSVLREAADLAEESRHDIKAARDKALEAITAAEQDGFRVGEDLSVTDTRRVDVFSIRARQISANEHAEDIRWTAEQLAQTDRLVGDRLQTKAAELEGIRFEGDGRDAAVQAASFKQSPGPDDPSFMTREQALAAWELLESDKAAYRSRCTVRPFVLPNEQAAYQTCLDDHVALDARQAAIEARLRELGVEILPPGAETPPGTAGVPSGRGLPPGGVNPPVEGEVTPGPASRPSEQARGGQSLWDEKGGEWRYFPGDKHHNAHWDYNAHNVPKSPWQNIPIGNLPPRTGQ